MLQLQKATNSRICQEMNKSSGVLPEWVIASAL
jgi:hypothetical protein